MWWQLRSKGLGLDAVYRDSESILADYSATTYLLSFLFMTTASDKAG